MNAEPTTTEMTFEIGDPADLSTDGDVLAREAGEMFGVVLDLIPSEWHDTASTLARGIVARLLRSGATLAIGAQQADVAAVAALAQKAGIDAGLKRGYVVGKRDGEAAAAQATRPDPVSSFEMVRDAKGHSIQVIETRGGETIVKDVIRDELGNVTAIVARPVEVQS